MAHVVDILYLLYVCLLFYLSLTSQKNQKNREYVQKVLIKFLKILLHFTYIILISNYNSFHRIQMCFFWFLIKWKYEIVN